MKTKACTCRFSRAEIKELFATAVSSGRITPSYQPIVDIRTNEIVGYEVLARWVARNGSAVPPGSFIPILEKHKIINLLFREICRRSFADYPIIPMTTYIALNISPSQLSRKSFADEVIKKCADSRISTSRLVLEITEDTFFLDADLVLKSLSKLTDNGIRIAIDDFGVGYSNIDRLSRFPFSNLKIDARFIKGISVDSANRRIVSSVIGLGHNLDMLVVAEGVENTEDARILQDMGCDLGQGWLFGRPLPASEVRKSRPVRNPELFRTLKTLGHFDQVSQLNTIYDDSPVGLCFLNADLRYVRANDKFASMHGRLSTDLIGKHIDEVVSPISLDQAKNILETTKTSGPQMQTYNFDGRKVMIYSNAIHDAADELIGYSLISVNMDEIQNSLTFTPYP